MRILLSWIYLILTWIWAKFFKTCIDPKHLAYSFVKFWIQTIYCLGLKYCSKRKKTVFKIEIFHTNFNSSTQKSVILIKTRCLILASSFLLLLLEIFAIFLIFRLEFDIKPYQFTFYIHFPLFTESMKFDKFSIFGYDLNFDRDFLNWIF